MGWNDYVREVEGIIPDFEARRCKHPAPRLAKQRTVRGQIQYFRWCFDCDSYALTERRGVVFISARDILASGIDPETVPLLRDNATPERQERWKETCGRCGAFTFCDLHHWAPKHLFGEEEADRWPTGYLCRTCHERWHRIVTPNMNRRGR